MILKTALISRRITWVAAMLWSAAAACAPGGSGPPLYGAGTLRQVDARVAKWDRIKATPLRARVAWGSLQELNDAINRTPYREDPGDVWQAPGAFLARGGDCEDYAIAKLVELGARGIAERWLVVVWDTKAGRVHAFALTREAGAWLVLDNQIETVLSWREALGRYRPIYAIDVARDAVYQRQGAGAM